MTATQQGESDELTEFVELLSQADDAGPVDPAIRRARRRRALTATAIVLAVLLGGVGGYTGWALGAPVSAPALSSTTPEAVPGPIADLRLPVDGAAAISVAGAEAYLGAEASGVWASAGTNEPRSIASITKLITALVILDAKPLASADDPGPTITFGKAAHDLYDAYYVRGATIAPMPTGTRMTEREALATMLIPSACNYAEALSTWAFGSQSRFLSATRAWLDAHGLAGTTIVEPTGLDPRNTSTPSDLLTIGKLAAAHPAVAAIAATRQLTVPGAGTISSTNSLLGVTSVTGLKTGNLGPGRFTLVYTASIYVGEAGALSVTGVVLDGASRESVDGSVRRALQSIRDGFHDVTVAESGREVGTYSTPWGSTAQVVMSETTAIHTWSDTPITVTMETTTPVAYDDGTVVGSITWTAGPQTVSSTLEIEGEIEPPTEWWRLTHPGELG